MRIETACAALAWAALGCGGAKAAPVAASPAPSEEKAPSQDAPPAGPVKDPAVVQRPLLPTTCAPTRGDAELCVPDPAFVKLLCAGSFPDVALTFFGHDAPWTRGYLTRDVDGWNAEGGGAARARLAFDEEMVVLRRREPPKNGIQVGGSGAGYLVLRVDGSCYTLDDIELTRKRPPKPKSGPVTFRFLEEAMQSALLKNARVLAAYDKRRKECKGVTMGAVSKACELADAELSRAVPEEVRKGIPLPPPTRLP